MLILPPENVFQIVLELKDYLQILQPINVLVNVPQDFMVILKIGHVLMLAHLTQADIDLKWLDFVSNNALLLILPLSALDYV